MDTLLMDVVSQLTPYSRTCSPQSPELRIERLLAERTFRAPNRIGGLIGNTTYRLNYLRDCWREKGGT